MTRQQRAASPLVRLALGLGMLAGVLLVVPGSSATSELQPLDYFGIGSTTLSTHTVLGRPARLADDTSGDSSSATSSDASELEQSTAASADSAHRFRITVGNASGLYPGRRNRLQIVFHNPQSVPISVRTATTTATGPAGCPLDTSLVLRTRTFIHRVIVPAHGSKAKSLRFGMRTTATDGCQNGVFTITVTATAVRA